MTNFLRFTTTDDRTVYIDPDSIIMISEHRYRVNDIGYVGSTITFHVGTSPSSINIKDDPEAVYHYLRKADLVNDQEMFLSLYKSAVPTHPPQKTRVYKPDGTSYLYPDEQEPLAPVDTPAQEPQPVPSIEDFIDYIDNHPINKVDKPEPIINLRVRPEPTTYRPLERGEKIYSSDKTKMNENVFLYVPSELVGKSFSLRDHPQIYRQFVFQPGDVVQHITQHDTPIYKVVKTVEDLAGHSYCVLEGRKSSVPVKKLVLYTPPAPITRTPPQETPPCNGNGEAQSTEE